MRITRLTYHLHFPGDAGYSFYFILSGGVSVEVSERDEKTGQFITQVCFCMT